MSWHKLATAFFIERFSGARGHDERRIRIPLRNAEIKSSLNGPTTHREDRYMSVPSQNSSRRRYRGALIPFQTI